MRVSRGCGEVKSGAKAVSAHVSSTQILPLLRGQSMHATYSSIAW